MKEKQIYEVIRKLGVPGRKSEWIVNDFEAYRPKSLTINYDNHEQPNYVAYIYLQGSVQ